MTEALEKIETEDKENTNVKRALIITGDFLIFAMRDELRDKVKKLTSFCESVLCCRVSPKQK